jgi:phosphatidylglycerol phospholipase C
MAKIDCKVENLPDKLFPMIKEEMFKYEHWETLLAPRIILGIWHVSRCTSFMRRCRYCVADLDALTFRQPKFILAAKRHLPFIPLYAICMSVATVRSFFFPALYSADGKRFRDEARAAGKKITVFTVNDRSEMLECIRWGVRAVITDEPSKMVSLQEQVSGAERS